MMDSVVQSLLEQAIDTPGKLHLLLIFHDNPRLNATAQQLAARSCRDIWSVSQALCDLVDAGVLSVAAGAHETHYRYAPCKDKIEAIHKLVRGYDDPFIRDRIHNKVRELESYASFNCQTYRMPLNAV